MNGSVDQCLFLCRRKKNPADILKVVIKPSVDNFFFTKSSCIYKQESHLLFLFVDGEQSRVTRLSHLDNLQTESCNHN